MIEFKNITKSFKVDFWEKPFLALDDVSFKIKEGVVTGFLGANGAGKTTLLKVLMKFIKQDSGVINFSESLGSTHNQISGNIGYLPERPYFYPYLTGREFVSYMGKINSIESSTIKSQIKKWAERFEISHALDRKVRTYSKGMLQRLGFVSVLIHSPKILILDEPLSGLDPVGRKDIKDVMREISNSGKSIFFSSHIVSDVEEIAQDVIVLEKGKLLYEGDIKELISTNNSNIYEIEGNININESEMIKSFPDLDLSSNGNFKLKISEEGKDKFIKEITQKGNFVDRLTKEQSTLEEIVYKIRG